MIYKDINDLLDWDELGEELKILRRYFHAHPELSFKEFNTSDKIAAYLEDLGLIVRRDFGETGVTASLKSTSGNDSEHSSSEFKTIAFRADIDALPIEEKTGAEYSSQNKGVMHACGHDSHMAVVLGAAKAAALNKDKIPGNIVFIFQPAEEKLSGAEKMLDAGILDHYSIDAVFGFHNWPELPTDKIGLKKGAIMAAVDKFEVELIGRGSHGSEPHKSADPIIMLNSFITQLQTIVSRKINPLEPAVVSIGKIEAGTAFNIIPDKVRLEGTVRSFSKNISSQVEREMENILKSAAYQGSYQLDYKRLIPPTVNDNKMTEMLYDLINADQNLPEAVYIDKASTVGEDFSLFLENIPGSYFFLGSKKGKEAKLHDAEYDVNEKILLPGVKVIMAVIKAYFSRD